MGMKSENEEIKAKRDRLVYEDYMRLVRCCNSKQAIYRLIKNKYFIVNDATIRKIIKTQKELRNE